MSREDRFTRLAVWLLLLPGVGQFLLLLRTMFGRIGFPYDLEWMEGGLLTHVQRIADGSGIYVPPSVDFIPFLYTPLYPSVMALLSPFFGIGYAVGRAISIVSTLGICVLLVAIVRSEAREAREAREAGGRWSLLGGIFAVGFFAATYPWVEGWYDLVRADSLFMLMVVGGLWGVRKWAKVPGHAGLVKLAFAATLLGLSFFAKQTGVLFVAAGGFLLLVQNWRRLPLYVGVTGLLGLGGTWLLNKVSAQWFWIYIYKTHQHHDFNMDRFYKSFGNMLWHFPLMSLVIAIGIILSAVIVAKRLPLSSAARGFALWIPIFAISVLVGAIGWGTEFAHFNAYIPAMLFGSLCAGLAIPTIAAGVAQLTLLRQSSGPFASPWPTRAGLLASLALALQLALSLWNPSPFIPSPAEEAAGNELIRRIADVEGDVLIPYHPWYAHLAGKDTRVHLMGLRDMSTGKVWRIRGLRESLRDGAFAAIFLDNRPIGSELNALRRSYRLDDFIPASAAPHVFTGAGAVWNKNVSTLVPRSIWVPNTPLQPPKGTRVLWNFENGQMGGWTPRSARSAWGTRPESRPLPKQGQVSRYGGRFYLSSFHGGDKTTGTLRSPPFIIDKTTLSFRISGGKSEQLRVELHVAGKMVKSATGTRSERMTKVIWNLAAHHGQSATLLLVDEDQGSWGHLNVDEFWLR